MLALPATPLRSTLEPKVRICLATPPQRLETPTAQGVLFQAEPEGYLLEVPRVARYYAHEGKEIRMAPVPGASEPELCHFLLAPVMAALVAQRGFFPLRASAILGQRGAIVIAGGAVTGKSTLTGLLYQRGYPVLTDKVSVIELQGSDPPLLHSGLPQLCLPVDCLDHLGLDSKTSLAGGQKRLVETSRGFKPGSVPVQEIIYLDTGHVDFPRNEVLKGVEIFEALLSSAYHPYLTSPGRLLQIAAQLKKHIVVRRVLRPLYRDQLQELADLVEGSI